MSVVLHFFISDCFRQYLLHLSEDVSVGWTVEIQCGSSFPLGRAVISHVETVDPMKAIWVFKMMIKMLFSQEFHL